MGLLDLFLQNKTTLDVEQIPQQGNGPVGTPTGEFNTGVTQFQQVWDSNNTYVNSFEGGDNVGIQPPTLAQTGLDVYDPTAIPSTTTPNTLTAYPATALGGLGQSAVQFLQIWTPVINYNDVVVGAPTSPLAQSLPETGLDNTDSSAVPTTVSPINTTNYPNLSTGEYNSVSTQYTQVYGPNNTYLNTYDPNVQPNSLDETGLDIENIGLISTTVAPSTNTAYPNLASGEFGGQSNNFNQIYTPTSTYLNTFNPNTQPNTIIQGQTGLDNINPLSSPTTTVPIDPTQYPNQATGEFGSNSNQYSSQYGPNNTYENNYVNNPVNFDTLQPTTLDETGLDNTNSNAAPTTTTPADPTQYPQFTQGEFNSAPNLYNQIWGPTNQYIINYNPNVQPDTIIQGQTGLDNINPVSAPTTTVPNTPTNYPNQSTGEFGGASSQYTSPYGPNSTYENNYINNVVNFDTLQTTTLDETGLDNTNNSFAPTTVTPNTTTQYPQFVQGEFNGAPTQYNQIWNLNNPYIINYNPNTQPSTLGQTGLDTDDPNFVPTTTTPSTVTQYPSVSTGEFGGGSTQYSQIYNSNNTYLNNVPVEDPNSPQLSTLSQTGLDTENQNAAPTTVTPNTVTQYPSLVSGEFSTGASQYTQNYGPNSTYLNSNFTNAQVGTLDLTGLDNTDVSSLPTTVTPTSVPASPQILPPQTFMGEFGGAPSQFTPQYSPNIGQGYLNNLNTIISNAGNPQISALNETGLDIEDPSAAPTTYVVPGIDNTTTYPTNATGEYNGPATPYGQTYTPEVTYENTIVNAVGGPVSVIENSTQYTGLDIENQNAAPTTYVVPEVDDTLYPVVQGAFTIDRIPKPYIQTFTPTNQYYSFMIDNFEGQVI
jgi:hypothetical protein